MKRIEPSRKHGPFDLRWLTVRSLKEAEQPEEARPEAITRAAVQAWEGEGGAVLPQELRGNPKTRQRPNTGGAEVGSASVRPRLVLLLRDHDSAEPDQSAPANLSVAAATVPSRGNARHKVRHSE
jgi:hypothetical protein